MGIILQSQRINKPNKTAILRKRENYRQAPLMRAVMFVNCWLWRGLRCPFHPVDHLPSLQNSYSSCCSHPPPLPLPSFPLSHSLRFRLCEAHHMFSGCFSGKHKSNFWWLICIFFRPLSLNTSHHLLDRDGNSAGREHSCKCLTLLAGPIVMLRVLLAVFEKEDNSWIYAIRAYCSCMV